MFLDKEQFWNEVPLELVDSLHMLVLPQATYMLPINKLRSMMMSNCINVQNSTPFWHFSEKKFH